MQQQQQRNVKSSLSLAGDAAEMNRIVIEKHGVPLIKDGLSALLEVQPGDPYLFLSNFFGKYEKPPDPLTAAYELISQVFLVDGEPGNCTRVHAIFWKAYTVLSAANESRKLRGAPGSTGVKGELYTKLITMVLKEIQAQNGLPDSFVSKLQHSLQCRAHEAVPFCVFSNGILLCKSIAEVTRIADAIYGILVREVASESVASTMNTLITHLKQAYTTLVPAKSQLPTMGTAISVQPLAGPAALLTALDQMSVRQIRRIVASAQKSSNSAASGHRSLRPQTPPSLNEFRTRFYDILLVTRE